MLSLKVSGVATLISLLIGVSVGTVIALTRFPGKKMLRDATNIEEIRIVNGMYAETSKR